MHLCSTDYNATRMVILVFTNINLLNISIFYLLNISIYYMITIHLPPITIGNRSYLKLFSVSISSLASANPKPSC